MPIVQWLPKPVFRRLMRAVGMDFFGEERNLNLLSRREFARLADGDHGVSFRVTSVTLLGWPSNLLLVGKRAPDGARSS